MGKLDGKTVLITGASRGIGLAIAQALDSEGAKLILTARGRGPLARAASQLRGTVMSMPADVTRPGDVKRLMAAVRKRVHRLDILINNAGVFTYKPFAKTTLDDFRAVISRPTSPRFSWSPRRRCRCSSAAAATWPTFFLSPAALPFPTVPRIRRQNSAPWD